jgi:hypothetical protein
LLSTLSNKFQTALTWARLAYQAGQRALLEQGASADSRLWNLLAEAESAVASATKCAARNPLPQQHAAALCFHGHQLFSSSPSTTSIASQMHGCC